MLPLLPASSYVPLFYLSASPLSLCAVRLLGCLSCSLLPACMYLYLPACIAYGCFSSLYCFVCTGYPYVSLLMYATCYSGIPCVNLSLSSVVMLVWYGLLSVWLACTWGAMWFYGYLYVAISLYGGFYGWRISGVLYASVWVSTVSLGYALSSLCGAGYALLSCMWLYVSGVLCLLAIRWGVACSSVWQLGRTFSVLSAGVDLLRLWWVIWLFWVLRICSVCCLLSLGEGGIFWLILCVVLFWGAVLIATIAIAGPRFRSERVLGEGNAKPLLDISTGLRTLRGLVTG